MKTLLPVTILIIFSIGMGPKAHAQPTDTNSGNIGNSQRGAVINRLVKRIEDFYVLPDEAQAITSDIRLRYQNGEYDHLSDAQQLASQLTRDLRASSHDVHFAIMYNPETYRAMESQLAALDGPNSRQTVRSWFRGEQSPANIGSLAGEARRNFFFSRLENLDGNIGYLRLERIPALDVARPTVDAAMAFLSHSDAIILDLRGNPGGVGGFIPYLMSYFFPPGEIYLYKRDFAALGITEEFSTVDELPGKRMADIPLYVLIDPFTGSAARNLAYTLQSFDRAILVGEASGDQGYKGAHSASLFPLAEGLLAVIPIGRVVNARTNSNWRDSGVQPDVTASSDDALKVAQQQALETLLNSTEDPEISQELSQALAQLEPSTDHSSVAPVDEESLREFVGHYGDRSIRFADHALRYTRQGMGAELGMEQIGKDLFALVLPGNARSANPPPNIRFDRDEGDQIVGISLIGPDGSVIDTSSKD